MNRTVTVIRKPFKGTVVHNVLKHGVGGINVDGCRISHNEPQTTTLRTAPQYSGTHYNGGKVGEIDTSTINCAAVSGRWPANVLMAHTPVCEMIGTTRVKTTVAGQNSRAWGAGGNVNISAWKAYNSEGYADEDGKEEVAVFCCASGCSIMELDTQHNTVSRYFQNFHESEDTIPDSH